MCQSHYTRFQVIKFKILNIFLCHVEENFGSKKCLLLKVSNPRGTNLKSYSLSSYDFKAKSICYNNLKSLKWNHLKKTKISPLHSKTPSNGIVLQISFPLFNCIPLTFSKFSKTHLWISLLKTLHQLWSKTIFFLASYQDGEGTLEPYIAESNVCSDDNDNDYEPSDPAIDPDTTSEKFEISPIKFSNHQAKSGKCSTNIIVKSSTEV